MGAEGIRDRDPEIVQGGAARGVGVERLALLLICARREWAVDVDVLERTCAGRPEGGEDILGAVLVEPR